MTHNINIVSIIMAAGRGSRMKTYTGNKTMLPLIPGASPFDGERPMLAHILDQLPPGKKAVIVHHEKDDLMARIRRPGLTFCEQPALNGTGGAVLAAADFLQRQTGENVLITMGDVPFVREKTYMAMTNALHEYDLMALGFVPENKKQYGMLEIRNGDVTKIIEWKFWKDFSEQEMAALTVCNAGIYAANRDTLIRYLARLSRQPRIVTKIINGEKTEIHEYFFTDLIEYMVEDGLKVGYLTAADETETMGVDDPDALIKAQSVYRERYL